MRETSEPEHEPEARSHLVEGHAAYREDDSLHDDLGALEARIVGNGGAQAEVASPSVKMNVRIVKAAWLT